MRYVTLIKRRDKNGVPGDWEIPEGVEPDKPITTHQQYWMNLANQHPVHPEIASHLFGEVQELKTPLSFKTPQMQADAAKAIAAGTANHARQREEIAARQAEVNKAVAEGDTVYKRLTMAINNAIADRTRIGRTLDPARPADNQKIQDLDKAIVDARTELQNFLDSRAKIKARSVTAAPATV